MNNWSNKDAPLFHFECELKCDLNWLYKKFRGICWVCRKFCPRDQASRDHILPKSLGGGYERDNQALAHKRCNTKRGNGYREILFRYYPNDMLHGLKDITVLHGQDLMVRFGEDRNREGFYLVVSKKLELDN